jgi:FkbM family methyltransferase
MVPRSLRATIRSVFRSLDFEFYRASRPPFGLDWASDLATRLRMPDSPIILDVGANIGQTSIPLAKRFPSANVHSFEPTRHSFERLAVATKDLHNIHTHHMALGDRCATMSMSTQPLSLTNSLRAQESDPESGREDVKVETADQFCADRSIDRIDIFKCDTEGYDASVLRGASHLLGSRSVVAFVIETTFDPANTKQSNFFTINDMLVPHGYICAGFYSTQYLMRRSTFGSFCDSVFILGSELPSTM